MIEPIKGSKEEKDVYLICDLDRTLLKNDFFAQSFYKLLVNKPFAVIKAWSKGLVFLKHYILDNYDPEINSVVNNNTLSLLKNESKHFKKVLLISASTDDFVNRIGKQFGIFDACHGTVDINLKGKNKLNFIREKGYTPFVYIGDSKADRDIFNASEYYYIIKNDVPVLVK